LPPLDPVLMLDCEGKNFLMVNIDGNMVGGTETVMVPDGAACTITVRNSTGPEAGVITANTNFVTYTVYHGDTQSTEAEPIVVFQGDSSETATSSFQRVPECFFAQLNEYVNVTTIYTSNGPSNKAIDWLVKDLPEHSKCERKFFLQRYALATTYFAAPGGSRPRAYDSSSGDAAAVVPWINAAERECAWPNVVCIDGFVTELGVQHLKPSGTIATEIGLLKNLTRLDMGWNSLTGSIPTQVGEWQSLSTLILWDNYLTGTIPTEIGNMGNLEEFEIDDNDVTGTIPTEIGNMNNLEQLMMWLNALNGIIPTEIGNMGNLKKFDIYGNNVTGTIPTEIGNMSNLERFNVGHNSINGTIPTEIGKLHNLVELNIEYNDYTGTIPVEIRNMTNLVVVG